VIGQPRRTPADNDLVDGYRLVLHPLLLSTGEQLFRERPTAAAAADRVTPTSTGVLMLSYEVA
jgi:hypothetical protein